MDAQNLELKYENTVLEIHAYVRADQDLAKLQKNVIRAAKGPRLDAFAAWMEIYQPGKRIGIEAEKFGDQRAMIEEFIQASKRPVVVFHLYINTDADPRKVGENIQRAARGPRFDDVVCAVVHYDGDNGRKVWEVIQQVVQRISADPNAKTFSV